MPHLFVYFIPHHKLPERVGGTRVVFSLHSEDAVKLTSASFWTVP